MIIELSIISLLFVTISILATVVNIFCSNYKLEKQSSFISKYSLIIAGSLLVYIGLFI
jgi:hypothetical protein